MAVTYNLKGTSSTNFQVGKSANGTVKLGELDASSVTDQQLQLTGHIIPKEDNTYDLGSSSKMFRDVYIGPGSLYVNGKKVIEDDSGSITVSTTVDQSLHIKTTGTGQTTIQSNAGLNLTTTSTGDITFTTANGQVNFDGDVIVNAAKSISSSNSNPITFADPIAVSGSSSMTNLTVTGDLAVQGSTVTIDTTTIDVKNAFRFEGATADDFETILTVVDPTADRTVSIPNATGTIVLQDTTDTLSNKTLASPTFSGTASGTLDIANTTTDDSLLITTTEDSSTAGPVISLKRNSASPADADYIGQVKFKGENDADQEITYAKITGKILDASDGSEDGMLEYAFIKGGSQNISARFRGDALQLLNGTNLYVGAGGGIQFEGATADAHEIMLSPADATADRTITLPDSSGTIALTSDIPGTDLVLDGSPQLGGHLESNGSNIKMADSDEIILGTDSDANIKHTGSDLVINETTRHIVIRTYADDGDVTIVSDDGSGSTADYFKADGSTGEAKLYHYGSEKVKTTSSGIQTTGTVSVNGAYTLPTSDGSASQFLQTDGSGSLSFATVPTSVVEDTTPQLGGDLDVNGNSITSTSNGDIDIAPNGTGNAKITSTGALILPVGTTAQRPATPVVGMFRFNSTTDRFEGYNGASWVILGAVLPTNEVTDYSAISTTAISNHDYGAITDADSIHIDYKDLT